MLALTDPTHFHRTLAQFNVSRVAPAMPIPNWQAALRSDLSVRLAEGQYLEALRGHVASMLGDFSGDSDQFICWFESLARLGPGQQHPLFDWLDQQASSAQMRWFLTQEAAGEAGFDDLLAYTQVKLPVQAKLECARNYWDEMGRGKAKAMHGPLLEVMVNELGLQPRLETTVWESLALSNTMIGLALTRRYTYQSIGALGVVELTAPTRVGKVANGMKRLGMTKRMTAYFDLHASLDVAHAYAWNQEIIRPLIDADPECARFIAEGALMRLVCGERCFKRYASELQSGQYSAIDCGVPSRWMH